MDLYELKKEIEEALKGKKEAAIAVGAELDKLGVHHANYCNNRYFLRKIGKREEYLDISSNLQSEAYWFFRIGIIWWTGCAEAGCEDRDCDGEHLWNRQATPDEVVFALDNYLHEELRKEQQETRHLREIANTLASLSQSRA